MRRAYQAAPARLGQGILAGIAAAALGGLAWALVFPLLVHVPVLKVLTVFMGAVIFLGVIRAMTWARAKPTLVTTLLASIISLPGILLGFASAIIGLAWQQYGLFPSWKLLADAVGVAAGDSLPVILMLWLFTVGTYTVTVWAGRRRQLTRYFSPKIEVLPGEGKLR